MNKPIPVERVISFDMILSYPTMRSSSTKSVSAKAMADQTLNQRPLSPKFKVKEGWTAGLSFRIISEPRNMYLETTVRFELVCISEKAGEVKKKRIAVTRILPSILPLNLFDISTFANLTEVVGSVNANL